MYVFHHTDGIQPGRNTSLNKTRHRYTLMQLVCNNMWQLLKKKSKMLFQLLYLRGNYLIICQSAEDNLEVNKHVPSSSCFASSFSISVVCSRKLLGRLVNIVWITSSYYIVVLIKIFYCFGVKLNERNSFFFSMSILFEAASGKRKLTDSPTNCKTKNERVAKKSKSSYVSTVLFSLCIVK